MSQIRTGERVPQGTAPIHGRSQDRIGERGEPWVSPSGHVLVMVLKIGKGYPPPGQVPDQNGGGVPPHSRPGQVPGQDGGRCTPTQVWMRGRGTLQSGQDLIPTRTEHTWCTARGWYASCVHAGWLSCYIWNPFRCNNPFGYSDETIRLWNWNLFGHKTNPYLFKRENFVVDWTTVIFGFLHLNLLLFLLLFPVVMPGFLVVFLPVFIRDWCSSFPGNVFLNRYLVWGVRHSTLTFSGHATFSWSTRTFNHLVHYLQSVTH